MRTHYIYLTKNLINGKMYIGQRIVPESLEIEKDSYLGSGTLLLSAVKKYGKENFEKQILDICHSRREADEKEIYYLEKYKVFENKDIFYNRAPGGQKWRDRGHSEFVSKIMKEYYSDKNNLLKALASRFNMTVEEYETYISEKKAEQEKIKYEKKIERLNKKIEKVKYKYYRELTKDLRWEFYNEKMRMKQKGIWEDKKDDPEYYKAVVTGNRKNKNQKNIGSLVYKKIDNKKLSGTIIKIKIKDRSRINNYVSGRIAKKETLLENLKKICDSLKINYGIDIDYNDLLEEAKEKYPQLFPEIIFRPIRETLKN